MAGIMAGKMLSHEDNPQQPVEGLTIARSQAASCVAPFEKAKGQLLNGGDNIKDGQTGKPSEDVFTRGTDR